ncbi:MAG: hypothetical protein VB065_05075, partial [Eubacteriales bacterium]|nr:hypothetical protein [Eubacteriales bacterium]
LDGAARVFLKQANQLVIDRVEIVHCASPPLLSDTILSNIPRLGYLFPPIAENFTIQKFYGGLPFEK